MKADRKRLKCEKLELLNQMRDLYKAIESKENEIRDVLKAYEMRTRETSFAVKKIIDGKVESEREKSRLELHIMDLIEEKNQLSLMVESKNVAIERLQKQINELKTQQQQNTNSSSSPRNSLGKDSDCGYSSSSTKSRDTLSSSLIESSSSSSSTTTPSSLTVVASSSSSAHHPHPRENSTPARKCSMSSMNACKQASSGSKSAHRASSKEERSLKCKSNDSFRSIYVKNNNNNVIHNGTLLSTNTTVVVSPDAQQQQQQRTSKQTAVDVAKSTQSSCQLSTSNLAASLAFAAEYEDDLSRALVGDSDEFIDLDDDEESNNKNETKTTTTTTPTANGDARRQKHHLSATALSTSLVCSSKSIAMQPVQMVSIYLLFFFK